MNIPGEKICPQCGSMMSFYAANLNSSTMMVLRCDNPDCPSNKDLKINSSFSKKDKSFEVLVENLSLAYNQFCLNRVIHEKVADSFYSDFSYTWNVILWGLEESYFLGLVKIFDKPRNISIYRFMDYEFQQHGETITKLREFRNKMLVHLDFKKMLEKDKFIEELNFKSDRSDIESLFNKLIELVDQIKTDFGFSEDLKLRFKQEKDDTRKQFIDWFNIFQKGKA